MLGLWRNMQIKHQHLMKTSTIQWPCYEKNNVNIINPNSVMMIIISPIVAIITTWLIELEIETSVWNI